MLFEPDRHEALSDTPWSDAQAHETVRAIVRDIEQHQRAEGHWPTHPLDEEGDEPAGGCKSLYLGSAGVLWALWYLHRQGAVELQNDPGAAIAQTHADYLRAPDTGEVVPSYFLGEAGILLVWWRLTGSSQAAERLYATIESNIANPTNEALWAAPGTMVAAWQLWEATHEARWRDLFMQNLEQLWRTWVFDDKAQCHLWTQDMYGKVTQYLGAGHGFMGNAYPLLRGAALLDAGRREALYARCAATLRTTALVEGDAANWPPGLYSPRPGGPTLLMQWCHGSPGVITALTHFPVQQSHEVDHLLIAAGHAIWQAGPLTKGYGVCHGTAGNGFAFLTLYQRTGDPLWLQRARAFAMHSIGQKERMRQQHGQGRYTLWTGDPGLAVYLWQCLQGTAGLPVLDTLQ